MAMNRRDFLKGGALSLTVLLAGGWSWLKATGGRSFTRARRLGRFPGRVVPLREAEVRTPGKWAG